MADHKRSRADAPDTERIKLHSRVIASGCWMWTGYINVDGYGTLAPNTRSAHRVSYEAFIGPIPEGLQIDHLCRVRHCVNPAHMEPVTLKVNVLRGEGVTARSAVVTHCPRGHPYNAENTYLNPKNSARGCRACRREAVVEWRRRQRLGLSAPDRPRARR